MNGTMPRAPVSARNCLLPSNSNSGVLNKPQRYTLKLFQMFTALCYPDFHMDCFTPFTKISYMFLQ